MPQQHYPRHLTQGQSPSSGTARGSRGSCTAGAPSPLRRHSSYLAGLPSWHFLPSFSSPGRSFAAKTPMVWYRHEPPEHHSCPQPPSVWAQQHEASPGAHSPPSSSEQCPCPQLGDSTADFAPRDCALVISEPLSMPQGRLSLCVPGAARCRDWERWCLAKESSQGQQPVPRQPPCDSSLPSSPKTRRAVHYFCQVFKKIKLQLWYMVPDLAYRLPKVQFLPV